MDRNPCTRESVDKLNALTGGKLVGWLFYVVGA